MKSTNLIAIRSFLLLLFFSLFQLAVFAQDNTGGEEKSTTTTSSSTKINVSTESGSDWYTQPWVWIVGGAVFVLLLVALLSNKGGDRTVASTSDRVTVKKSVERDTDTAL